MSTQLNRRALVAGAAALPAIAAPVTILAGEPDPIFAAIEDHRAKNAAFRAALHDGSDEEAQFAACDIEWDAAHDMFLTVPTTRAGIEALVAYVIVLESAGTEILNMDMSDCGDEWVGARALLQTLHAAFLQIGGA
jgi:hypothetical protein